MAKLQGFRIQHGGVQYFLFLVPLPVRDYVVDLNVRCKPSSLAKDDDPILYSRVKRYWLALMGTNLYLQIYI